MSRSRHPESEPIRFAEGPRFVPIGGDLGTCVRNDENLLVTKEFCISRRIAAALTAEARSQPNIECCGLLAGTAGTIEEIFPAHNALNSAKAYEIAPDELFSLFRSMRDSGLELAGIYHSHPTGDNSPSKSDIDLAYYPGVPYVILSPLENTPQPIRAFLIVDGAVSELEIKLM